MKRVRKFPTHIVVFLAPAVLIYTVFMIYPMLSSLWLSLLNRIPGGGTGFVGLQNYVTLLTSEHWAPRFWNAFRNNVVFFVIHMLVQNPVALALAVMLNSRIRAAAVYRTIIFTPAVLSVVLAGFAWRMVLNPVWGISYTILDFFGLGDLDRPWLGLEETALVTLSLISVWQNVGIPMVLFLAALVRIPDELLEAARVDGASAWQVFRHVQLPLIMPSLAIVAVLTFVGNFNAFDLIYATQGSLAGPNFSTDIMGTFFFRTFFGFQLQPGDPHMGAAVAGMMFLIILTGVLLYLFGWQRRMERIEY